MRAVENLLCALDDAGVRTIKAGGDVGQPCPVPYVPLGLLAHRRAEKVWQEKERQSCDPNPDVACAFLGASARCCADLRTMHIPKT